MADLFEHEGGLWRGNEVLRPVYCRHFLRIENSLQLRATIRAGGSTDVGGYPVYLVLDDGEALCFDCARREFKLLASELRNGDCGGWRPIGSEINWEDADLYCAHCGESIPAAYGD